MLVCDICDHDKAEYDGRTRAGFWAYMCDRCFRLHGIGLGLGKGQYLDKSRGSC